MLKSRLILSTLFTISGIVISVISFNSIEKLYEVRDCIKQGDILVDHLYDDDNEKLTIPFFFVRPGRHIFYASVGKISSEHPVVYLPYIDGNSIKVYFNNILIGGSGNLFSTNSLRWNRPELFLIPPNLIKDTNTLSIEVNTENTIGIFEPVFLGEFNHIKHRYYMLFFLNQILTNFNVTLFTIVGLLFLLIPLLIRENYHRAMIGGALIFYGIYNIDYGYIPFLPIPYSLYKKIIISLLYLSVPFYALGFTYEFGFKGLFRKTSYLLLILNISLIFVLLSTPNNSVVVRETYLKLNFCVFLGILWILLIFIKKVISSIEEKRFEVYLSYFLISLYFPYAFRDVYILVTNMTHPLLNQNILPIFLFANLMHVLDDFAIVYRKFLLERKKAALLELESMRDPLTGALNRRFILKIAEILPDNYAIAILDLDNFKYLNDLHGHLVGDCVLKSFAQEIRKYIRKDDHIVRYGGDEFILMLYKCNMEEARTILEKIHSSLSKYPIKCHNQIVFVSFSYGLADKSQGNTLNDLIKVADKNLYETKKAKKTTQ